MIVVSSGGGFLPSTEFGDLAGHDELGEESLRDAMKPDIAPAIDGSKRAAAPWVDASDRVGRR